MTVELLIDENKITCEFWTSDLKDVWCSLCPKKDTSDCKPISCSAVNPWCG